MALRLVAEFDLWEDVFPWLRVQRAASAGAETPGGGAGAGGAHLAGGGEEEVQTRQMDSNTFKCNPQKVSNQHMTVEEGKCQMVIFP